MIVHPPHKMSADRQQELRKAVGIEWITIFFLITISAVMYLAMGNSQAMKTAWVEDMLSIVPPILFLLSVHIRAKPPSQRFPYGLYGISTATFAGAALTLLIFGVFLLFDAIMKLVSAEHPTIGTIELFGRHIWLGWLMIAALVYSVVPPMILGRIKIRYAKELHDKTLYTDAQMNKADWLTGLAAMVGVIGIGFGWWWADGAAAAVISLDIIWDGGVALTNCVADICERRPTSLEYDEPEEDMIAGVIAALKQLDWVVDADVSLREEGYLLNGEAYVVPRDEHDLVRRISDAAEVIRNLHWRIHAITIQPVEALRRHDSSAS